VSHGVLATIEWPSAPSRHDYTFRAINACARVRREVIVHLPTSVRADRPPFGLLCIRTTHYPYIEQNPMNSWKKGEEKILQLQHFSLDAGHRLGQDKVVSLSLVLWR
jgi:hypothetical protein